MTKKSNKKLIGIVIAVIICIIVVGIALMKSGDNSKGAVLVVGEEEYSETEINFYFQNAYKTVLDSAKGYEQFIGLDVNKDLKDQDCSMSETGQSWYEYIMEQAKKQLIQTSAEYQDALKNGYTDEDAEGLLKNYVEYYELLATEAGEKSLEDYLVKTYGEDFDKEVLDRLLVQQSISEKYEQDLQNSLEFSDDELEDYYQGHISEFTEYSYLYAYIKDDSIDTNILMNAKSQNEFKKLTKELTGMDVYEMNHIKGTEIGDENAQDIKWIADSARKEGDCYLGEAGGAKYVLYYISSDDMGKSQGDEQWKVSAKAGLKTKWIENWQKEVREAITVKE